MAKAYDRITWRGVTLDRRTAATLEWAEKRAGVTISVSQGSDRPSTSYSGSTHTGSGAVDIRVTALTDRQRKKLVHALKDAGMACWYRKPCAAWGPHIHALSIGSKQMANSARGQVASYDAGRSGLASNGADNTYRADPKVKFNYKKRKPVPR